MRSFFFKVVLFCITINGAITAQTGINTYEPSATLDVTATKTDPTTAEGIIAPRLTLTQLVAKDAMYSTAQAGTLLYVSSISGTTSAKTVNITKTGYYYFDGALWQKLADNLGDHTANQNIKLGTNSINGGTSGIDNTKGLFFDSGNGNAFQQQELTVMGKSFMIGDQTLGNNQTIYYNQNIGGTQTVTGAQILNSTQTVAGTQYLKSTAIAGTTGVSQLVVNNSTGEVQKVAVTGVTDSKPLNYVEYYITNVNQDWINAFYTGILSKDYIVIVVSSNFTGAPITLVNGGAPAPQIYASDNGTQWVIKADFADASTVGAVNGGWAIRCLVINNSLVKNLGAINYNFSGKADFAGTKPGGL